jgi:SAM-dependent methyltransferase
MITTRLQDPTRGPLATLLRNPALYQRWLERRFPSSTAHPTLPTEFPDENAVLLGQAEVDRSVEVVRHCGLPEYIVAAKNWDSLAALGAVLARTDSSGRVLDAGGIMESVISSWLWLYGFRDLWCINPVFPAPFRHGGIHYEPGDATDTRFDSGTFDLITCLSVVEHGVDLDGYFREASRILKPGGALVTSTDYYPDPIDTDGKHAYGVPVKIFNREEIEHALDIAARNGLRPSGPIPLDAVEKPVHWELTDLDYTFLVFTLVKGDLEP